MRTLTIFIALFVCAATASAQYDFEKMFFPQEQSETEQYNEAGVKARKTFTHTEGKQVLVEESAYNKKGQLQKQVQYKNGSVISHYHYSYTTDGRLASFTDSTNTKKIKRLEFVRDGGKITGVSTKNMEGDFSWDADSRSLKIDKSADGNIWYDLITFDEEERITNLERHHNGTKAITTYTYDDSGSLASSSASEFQNGELNSKVNIRYLYVNGMMVGNQLNEEKNGIDKTYFSAVNYDQHGNVVAERISTPEGPVSRINYIHNGDNLVIGVKEYTYNSQTDSYDLSAEATYDYVTE